MTLNVAMVITGDASSAKRAAADEVAALKSVEQQVKASSEAVNQANATAAASTKGLGEELKLNRTQWMEITAAARHSIDALIAGANPMRVLAMEGTKLSAVFSSGNGGVAGVLGAVASAINPVYVGLGLVAAAAVGGVLVARSWAAEYTALAEAAKSTTMRLEDLAAMKNLASKSGSDFDVSKDMVDFAKSIREAEQAGGQLKKILDANNISLRDSAGHSRDIKAVFADVARLVANSGNELDKQKLVERLSLGPDAVKYMEDYTAAAKAGTLQLTAAEQQALQVKKQFSELGDRGAQAWDTIKGYGESLVVFLAGKFLAFEHGVNEMWARIAGAMEGLYESIKSLWANLPGFIELMGKEAVNSLIDLTQSAINSIAAPFNLVMEKLGRDSVQLVDLSRFKLQLSTSAQEVGGAAGEAYTKGFASGYGRTSKWLNSFLGDGSGSDAEKSSGTGTIKGPLWQSGAGQKDKTASEQKRWDTVIRDSVTALKEQSDAIGKSAGEVAKLKKEEQLWSEAHHIFGDRLEKDKNLYDDVTKKINAQGDAYGKLADKIFNTQKKREAALKIEQQQIAEQDKERAVFDDLLQVWTQGGDVIDWLKQKMLSLLDTFISNVAMGEKDTAQSGLFGNIASTISGFFTNMTSAGGSTSLYAHGGAFGSAGAMAFASGGAFTNQVVSEPTYFKFGASRLGIMGEAGPEAVMPLRGGHRVGLKTPAGESSLPLTRMADGSLGVAMGTRGFAQGDAFGDAVSSGGAGVGGMTVNTTIKNYSSEPVQSQAKRSPTGGLDIEVMVGAAVNRHVARGGLDDLLTGRFSGLSRRTERHG